MKKYNFFGKQDLFSKQLAMWFYHVEWHYVTLLSVFIQSVDVLPDDGDVLVSELLNCYPVKPDQATLSTHLLASKRLSAWFGRGNLAPNITHFNLNGHKVIERVGGRHPEIPTLEKLAQWLGLTQPELHWLANLWRFDSTTPEILQHYHYQLLEKRNGGMRLIEKPKGLLREVQRKVYQGLLSTLEVHPAAHGFCKGRSCLTHATLHTGKRYLLLFDITECFQSIGWEKVKAVYKRMGYPEAVCVHLTALCTHSARLKPAQLVHFDSAQRERIRHRHLPQGAPSSPALANAALHQLDLRLSALARHFGMEYSRYADDISMSGNSHRELRYLQAMVARICLEEGVALNHRKTRIKRSHQKQQVVGIVVNSKANIDRHYFDTLKATLTNCTRFGLESQNRQQHPHFRAHLLGKIQYVKSLNERRGLKLERLYRNISQ